MIGCVIDGSSSSLWPLRPAGGEGRGGEGEGRGGKGEGRESVYSCTVSVSGSLPSPVADQVHNHVLLEFRTVVNGNLTSTHHVL